MPSQPVPRTLRLLPPRRGPRSRPARRGLRLPEFLACAGIALIGWWPGDPLSSTHLEIVAMCLLPLAVRTLLRWEEFATPPYGLPEPAAGLPGAKDAASQTSSDAASGTLADDTFEAASLDRALVGLAVLDVTSGGLLVRQANLALHDLLGPIEPGTPFAALADGDDRVLMHAIGLALADGRLDAWKAELDCLIRPASGADGPAGRCRLQVTLTRLPSTPDGPCRVSLHAVEVAARPAEPAPSPAPTAPTAPTNRALTPGGADEPATGSDLAPTG
jgi:hypothetical protein